MDKMKKTALILMFITIISKVFGFIGEIVLSYFYGASSISDAYLVSLTIPSVLFSLIGVGISTGYIPVYSSIIKEKGKDRGYRFTNNLISFLMIICLILIILTLSFTKEIVLLLASGFTGDTLKLAIAFTRIAILSVGFSGLIYIFNGYLQVNEDFFSPAIMVIPFNIVILFSIIISAKINVIILSLGHTLAIAIQFLLLIPSIYRKSYKYCFTLDKGDKYLKKTLILIIPIIIGSSVHQINRLIDRAFASNITIGGVSAINYAYKLEAFILDVFVMTLVTIMYPMISKMASEKNIEDFKKIISQTMVGISVFVIPASLGGMIFAQPIVELLFGRGAFDSKAIFMTSNALCFYSLGMIANGLREVLLRGFYSLQGIKVPLTNAIIAIGLNTILNLLLYKPLGIGGIALATSIALILSTLLLFISFKRRIGDFGLKTIVLTFFKIIIASGIIAIISKSLYNALEGLIGGNLSLIISVGIGAGIYFIIIIIIKIREVDIIIAGLKGRIKR